MLQLIRYEFQKLGARKILWFISALILIGFLFQFGFKCKESRAFIKEYHHLKGQLNYLTDEEKEEKLSWMEQNLEEMLWQSDPEEIDTDALNTQIWVVTELQKQLVYKDEYVSFLNSVEKQAEDLKLLSVFSGVDSFSNRSIIRGEKEYRKLHEIQIEPDFDQGILILHSDATEFIILLAIIFSVGVVLYIEEKNNGIRRLISTTARGRQELALAKWVTFSICATILTIIFCGAKLLIAGTYIGFGKIDRSLQSVGFFKKCTYIITVRDYLILRVIIPCIVMQFCVNLLVLLFSLINKVWIHGAITGIWAITSFLEYRFIQNVSDYNFLKYVNPFASFDISSRFSEFQSVNLFGFATPIWGTTVFIGIVLSITFVLFYILLFSGVITVRGVNIQIPKKRIKIHHKVGLITSEIFRMSILRFGVFIFMLLIFFMVNGIDREENLLNEEMHYYDFYGSQISGVVNENGYNKINEFFDEIENEEEILSKDTDKIEQSDESLEIYRKNKIRELKYRRRALEHIQGEYIGLMSLQEDGIPVHYISEIKTEYYFNNEELIRNMLIILLMLAILVTPAFSEDLQKKMNSMISTTKGGRLHLFMSRYLLFLLIAVFCLLAHYVPVLINWTHKYTMGDFFAPIQSVIQMMQVKGNSSIFQLIVFGAINSLVGMLAYVSLISFLTMGFKDNSSSLIAGMVIILIDFLPQIFRIPILSGLTVSAGFNITTVLMNSGYLNSCVFVLIKNLFIFTFFFILHLITFITNGNGRLILLSRFGNLRKDRRYEK